VNTGKIMEKEGIQIIKANQTFRAEFSIEII
jgi:hypothetical protein